MSESGSAKVYTPNIGEAAKPPPVVLPYPASLFLNRSKRFLALASGHQLEGYLRFLATVTRAQHDTQATLAEVVPPPAEVVTKAVTHGMPPLSRTSFKPDELAETTLNRFLETLAKAELPAEAAAAVKTLQSMTSEQRHTVVKNVLNETIEQDRIAQHVLVLAGLQVHFTRLAAKLDQSALKSVADGICPTCGSRPLASSVVNWPGATNTRFCTCSLCATMWYVVRVKCLLCGSNESINFRLIEGQPDTIKAETCDKCHGYVKIFYQIKDPTLEPLADDVASLGLDILLSEDGWSRGGYNPFLLGY